MYWFGYSNHNWPGFLIHMKTKYVRPSVVPHDIKVELSSCDVSHIQIRSQDTLARKVGTGEHLPKGIDNATTTTRKDCLWLITKWCHVGVWIVGTTYKLVARKNKTATFQRNMLHGSNPSISPIRCRCAVDLDALRVHRHAQERHIILPTNHCSKPPNGGIEHRHCRSVTKAPNESF